ncbi:MAG TPA: PaaI family thioesterase [Nevskiaceae bacterium]|nr:PaaI family thioesterase [Nevskiaceae bacterium]
MNPLHDVQPGEGQALFIEVIPHNAALGLRYVESGIGRIVVDLPYQDHLVGDPETGVIAGGVITTMFDAVSGLSLLSKLPVLNRIATLDLRIDYLRPAKPGRTVRCTAECYKLTRHIGFTRAVAHDGDPDDPIGTAAGSFVVFGDDKRVSHFRAVPGAPS